MHLLKSKFYQKILGLILIGHSALVFCLPTDNQQPAQIVADSVIFNRNTGIGVYTGHVQIKQGSTLLTADQVTTHSNKQNQLIKAIAIGKPTQYQTQPQENQAILIAKANQITYYPIKKLVILTGDAQVTQGDNHVVSPEITYDMAHDVTHTTPVNGQHTIITFIPDKIKDTK